MTRHELMRVTEFSGLWGALCYCAETCWGNSRDDALECYQTHVDDADEATRALNLLDKRVARLMNEANAEMDRIAFGTPRVTTGKAPEPFPSADVNRAQR